MSYPYFHSKDGPRTIRFEGTARALQRRQISQRSILHCRSVLHGIVTYLVLHGIVTYLMLPSSLPPVGAALLCPAIHTINGCLFAINEQGAPQVLLPSGIYAVRAFNGAAASDEVQQQHQSLLSSLQRDGLDPEGGTWALTPPCKDTTLVQRREIVQRLDEKAFFSKCWRTASAP